MNRIDHLPLTRPSLLEEAGQGNWDRFWGVYLQPCLKEIGLELRRVGVHRVQPEELLHQLYEAIARPARFQKKYRDLLQQAGEDPEYRGNLPAKFQHLLAASSGSEPSPRARFRTLLRRVISHTVTARLRELIESELGRIPGPSRKGRVSPVRGCSRPCEVDAWADRLWIAEILRATCRDFFRTSDNSRTRAGTRYPRLLYCSLVREWTQEEIAAWEGLDRSWVTRQLMAAEECLARCLSGNYPPGEKEEVERVLTAQSSGLIAATYQEEYRAWYGDPDSTKTAP